MVECAGQERRHFPRTRMTEDLARKIVVIARSYNLPPLLVLEIMRQESGFKTGVISSAGAGGLMQLMPTTGRRFGVSPEARFIDYASIHGGCRYLAYLSKLFAGRVDLILAAYNAGEGAVIKYGRQIPPYAETQNYVRSILGGFNRALDLEARMLSKRGLQPSSKIIRKRR